MKRVALGMGLGALIFVGWYSGAFQMVASRVVDFASVFFVDSSTPQTLHTAYAQAKSGGQKFKVLIVPGHDDEYSGTSYGGLREADLTVQEGKLLAAQFAQDPNIEVRLARTASGYDPDISSYFSNHWQDIINYRLAQTKMMKTYMASGNIQSDVVVDHNTAKDIVALRLYGINMWANANNYQLIIHVHFNDTPRANRAKPGPYTGFAVYVPEHQFSNAKGSLAVANDVVSRLAQVFNASTLPQENGSPVEDQQLIAIGSNNSLDASSMLIEYAYIYEPSIQKSSTRGAVLQQMAQQTYAGVEDFLNKPELVLH
jgi:N-acetylmuramoyl-L-alanine amidase